MLGRGGPHLQHPRGVRVVTARSARRTGKTREAPHAHVRGFLVLPKLIFVENRPEAPGAARAALTAAPGSLKPPRSDAPGRYSTSLPHDRAGRAKGFGKIIGR